MVAQGACPIQGVRNEDLSIAGMAEEITHVVEDIFSLTEWISGVRGVAFFPTGSGWRRLLVAFKHILLFKSN